MVLSQSLIESLRIKHNPIVILKKARFEFIICFFINMEFAIIYGIFTDYEQYYGLCNSETNQWKWARYAFIFHLICTILNFIFLPIIIYFLPQHNNKTLVIARIILPIKLLMYLGYVISLMGQAHQFNDDPCHAEIYDLALAYCIIGAIAIGTKIMYYILRICITVKYKYSTVENPEPNLN